jgi:hypothetical protein
MRWPADSTMSTKKAYGGLTVCHGIWLEFLALFSVLNVIKLLCSYYASDDGEAADEIGK